MNGQTRSTTRATLLVLFSACCFGSISIFITLGTRTGASLVDLLAWRYVIAAALLVIAGGGLGAARAQGSRGLALLSFAGAGQAAIAFISLSALKYLSAATLTFLFYTYPAWVTIIAALRRTEPLTPARVGALALSLAGLTIMVGMPGSAGVHPIGVALALTAALMYAVYIPMINHFGKDVPPALTGAYASGGAGIIFMIVAVLAGGPSVHLAPMAWFGIIGLAVVSTLIGFIAFLRGLAVIGPVRSAIVSTVEPFWAALLASLVLGQALAPHTLLGGVLIAAAVIVLQLGPRTADGGVASSA